MSQILLVRHGESEWNALGRWQGQADPPLSEHGRRQALVAARSIGTVG
jgi:probable phosphoglycerate mutase